MEPRKPEKPTIPIIPHSSVNYNQDASSLLREVFHDVLEEPVLSENIVRNWASYEIDSTRDKATAKCIQSIKEKSKLEMEALHIVEEKLAHNIKTNLEKQKLILKDPIAKEFNKYKRDIIFPKIDKEVVKDYGLITGEDLKPSKILQKLDFTFETKIPKLKRKDPNMVPTKLPNIKPGGKATLGTKNLPGRTKSRVTLLAPSEVSSHALQTKKTLNLHGSRSSPKLMSPESRLRLIRSCFRLNTKEVVFTNYKLNVVYKKSFKLQNISTKVQQITVPNTTEYKNGCFTVKPQFDPDTLRLSSGMSAKFIVEFKTDTYMDVFDYFLVNGHKVKLLSQREPPKLTAFLMRDTISMTRVSHPRFEMTRAEALNNTIECGACFVGERLNCNLIFKNIGGPGKFFMMTEMQWSTQDINTLHNNLQLDFGDFSITPNYFEMEKDDFIITKLEFYGAESSTNIENISMVCDNITWESIDFVADVIEFDKYTITIDRSNILKIPTFIHEVAQMHQCTDEYLDWDLSNTSSNNNSSVEPSLCVHLVEPDNNHVKNISTDVALHTSSVDIIDEVIFDYLISIDNDPLTSGSSATEEDIKCRSSGVLFIGKTLAYKKIKQNIKIRNNSQIHLKYRFDLHEINLENYKHPMLKGMQELQFDCVGFEGNEDNILPAYGEVTCNITACPETTEEGFYGVTIGFVIVGIPLCAVKLSPDNPNFLILQPQDSESTSESNATPVVDVQVALFDAICFVRGLRILVMPRNVFGSHPHHYGAKVKREFKLNVDCDQFDEIITGYWASNQWGKVMIYPKSFKIKPRRPFIFDVEYDVTTYKSTVERICVVIEKHYTRSIDLKIEVEPPHLKFNKTIPLQMGLCTVGNTYKTSFKILNSNFVNVDWEIREQYIRDLHRPKMNGVQIQAKNLGCGDVDVTYEIVARAPIRWTSYLLLCTIYDGKKKEDCRLQINYEVADVAACIHTDFSECPILSPPEMLYVNTPKTYSVCFHNLTQVDVVFELSEIYGKHADLLDISVSPKRFTIQNGIAHRIDVTITPVKAGMYDDIFLAFNQVEMSENRIGDYCAPAPVVLSVVVAVDDIYVKVVLPGVQNEVFWPPRVERPSINYESNQNLDLAITEEVSPETFNDASKMEAELTMSSTDLNDDLPSDLVKYLKELAPSSVEDESSFMSSFSSDTTVTETSCSRFNPYGFEDVSKYVVEICGVHLKQVYTCNIKLENLTPVTGCIQVVNLNFPPNNYEQKKIDVVLQALKYQSIEDEWEKRLGPYGIAIDHRCLDGTQNLKPFGTNEIILSIYANTWGTYKEDLLIDFNNILPLKITLIIEIIGIPLEFPIGINNIHKTAILRFGTLAYKSNFQIRQLQVRNVSVVPVNVIWHIYMRHTHGELANEPITILFDVYHPNDDDTHDEETASQGNLMIAHGKCIGRSNHRIFKMSPKEMIIPPKQTLALKLGLNTRAFAASYNTTEIEAYLIGYTHLPQHLSYSPLLYRRPTGHANVPTKAKLTATLDLPVLKLDMCAEDLHFGFFADHILDSGYIKQVRQLTFKNHHQVEANVCFQMDPPFVLESARTSTKLTHLKTSEKDSPRYSAVVQPDECVQLALSYTIDVETLFRIAKQLFDDSDDDEGTVLYSKLNLTEQTFSLEQYLHIEQAGFIRQNIPVSLKIYLPILEVTNEIDFGDVYLGNVVKQLCIIRNYSLCRVEFTVHESKTFRVMTKNGVIKPGRRDFPMVYDLYIVFVPQMLSKFEEKIILRTRIPSLHFTIKVSGVGRQNERYYMPDTC